MDEGQFHNICYRFFQSGIVCDCRLYVTLAEYECVGDVSRTGNAFGGIGKRWSGLFAGTADCAQKASGMDSAWCVLRDILACMYVVGIYRAICNGRGPGDYLDGGGLGTGG